MYYLYRLYRSSKYAAPITSLLFLLATVPARANTTQAGLPWEAPLTTIQASLTGPVASALAIIALFAAGSALVFGDELSSFVKRVCVGVMALALLIAGSTFLTKLGLTGSVI